jgi:hypothetical protein
MRTGGSDGLQTTAVRAMPTEPVPPPFPSAESLRRFFGMDPGARVPLAELASLLGVSREGARAILREEGGHPAEGGIAWAEAAALLFDAWPRAEILAALGPEAGAGIPAEFRPVPVTWSVPLFVIRAMEQQAARDGRRIDDYVADVLHAAIEPATLAALGEDAFLRAFHYPMAD